MDVSINMGVPLNVRDIKERGWGLLVKKNKKRGAINVGDLEFYKMNMRIKSRFC